MRKWLVIALLSLSPSVVAADELLESAEKGDAEAQLKLGLQLLSDDDRQNDADGVTWLEISAAGGSVTAHYNLGARYQDGDHVKKDANKALLHLSIAAELGEIRAMNRLAGIYYRGEIVPRNDILAVKWVIIAAGLGSETAQKNADALKAEVSKKDAFLGATSAESWVKNRKAVLFPKSN